jgi:beta-xylosidase
MGVEPDNTKWSSGRGLVLHTATLTNDFYAAHNTLTHRIVGPRSMATIELDYSAMQDGDMSGLAALRDSSAWIGVKKSGAITKVVMTNSLELGPDWNTSSFGTEAASKDISGGKIWLRVDADVRTTADGGRARFYYSTDSINFVPLGTELPLKRDWKYFLGYRFGIFNYATKALGGSVRINSFQMEKP